MQLSTGTPVVWGTSALDQQLPEARGTWDLLTAVSPAPGAVLSVCWVNQCQPRADVQVSASAANVALTPSLPGTPNGLIPTPALEAGLLSSCLPPAFAPRGSFESLK